MEHTGVNVCVSIHKSSKDQETGEFISPVKQAADVQLLLICSKHAGLLVLPDLIFKRTQKS